MTNFRDLYAERPSYGPPLEVQVDLFPVDDDEVPSAEEIASAICTLKSECATATLGWPWSTLRSGSPWLRRKTTLNPLPGVTWLSWPSIPGQPESYPQKWFM